MPQLIDGKGKFQIQIKGTNDAANGLKAAVKCQAKDVYDLATGLVKQNTDQNTDASHNALGTCQGGPNDGNACKKASDCKDSSNPKAVYFCTDGDEYNCTIDGLIQSNSDDCPACGGALPVVGAGGIPLRHSRRGRLRRGALH